MQVVHWGRRKKFIQAHPNAATPLKQWKQAVQQATWKTPADVTDTFRSADRVEGKLVFDIKGNDYRLVAIVAFELGKLYIKHVMTHSEYDESRWKSG